MYVMIEDENGIHFRQMSPTWILSVLFPTYKTIKQISKGEIEYYENNCKRYCNGKEQEDK